MVNQLLGRKLGMTQIYREDGACVPVTVLEVGPCTVVQVKTQENDGYTALQISFGDEKKKHRTPKAEAGHYKKSGAAPQRLLQEIKWDGKEELKTGDKITVDIFEKMKKVDVVGTSKGRGFMSAIQRWGFHRQPASHGCSDRERAPGSLSGGFEVGKGGGVKKGKKMAGHWGVERVTMKNLDVALIDKAKNLLFVHGGVPGPNGGFVMVKQALWVPPKESTVVSKKTKAGKK